MKRWFVLPLLLVLAGACTTAELTRRTVEEPAERYYRNILLQVDLADATDTVGLTDRLVKQLEQRDLQVIRTQQIPAGSIHHEPGSVLLSIDELDRRIETVDYHRSYGRTSLTRMRGRKTADVPVITLRASLQDIVSGRLVFQADYVTRGPWYADSTMVVTAIATTLVEQLEREGFITANNTASTN